MTRRATAVPSAKTCRSQYQYSPGMSRSNLDCRERTVSKRIKGTRNRFVPRNPIIHPAKANGMLPVAATKPRLLKKKMELTRNTRGEAR